jgi:chromosome segregation ATPase
MVECPLATAYLFEHQGMPSLCQLCTPLIGNFYYSTLDREPYSLPMHNHCLCSWDIIILEGIFQARKEDLLSDLEQNDAELQQNQIETEQCESRLADLDRELEADILARAEAEAGATAARQEAERLRLLEERLQEEMDSLEKDEEARMISLQEEIDILEAQALEEDEKAEGLEDQLAELHLNIASLEGEKASQEEAKAALQARKTELDKVKAELEACLELPVIEELARSAAGPRLQGL